MFVSRTGPVTNVLDGTFSPANTSIARSFTSEDREQILVRSVEDWKELLFFGDSFSRWLHRHPCRPHRILNSSCRWSRSCLITDRFCSIEHSVECYDGTSTWSIITSSPPSDLKVGSTPTTVIGTRSSLVSPRRARAIAFAKIMFVNTFSSFWNASSTSICSPSIFAWPSCNTISLLSTISSASFKGKSVASVRLFHRLVNPRDRHWRWNDNQSTFEMSVPSASNACYSRRRT